MKSRKTVLGLQIAAIMILTLLAANAFAQNAVMTIKTYNYTSSTATPSSVQYLGTLSSLPADITANNSSPYITETSFGNVTSFHDNYTSGSKKCHFDAASYTSGGNCVYTKAATSTGGTPATCTANITAQSSSPNPCSFSISFGIQ
ncbi:MAG: hypothetical protein ABFC57_18220 [Veillonellales bacterium]|jgi:hypothetical protein